MAAAGSVPPLSSPVTPTFPHGPPTPSAFKVKSKLMDRHAQEGAHSLTPHAPPNPVPRPLPPLRPLATVPPPLRLDTTPPPKKRLCTSTAYEPCTPTPSPHYPASPPQSPAPVTVTPEDLRGTTKLPPLTCLPSAFNPGFHRPQETVFRWSRNPLSPPAHAFTLTPAHLPTDKLDLRIPKAGGQVSAPWRNPTPHSPPRSAPPHTAHLTHHYHHHHHSHHQRHLSHPRPRPRLSPYAHLPGSPIMLSEPPMTMSHQDAMPYSSPTALNKPLVMGTSQQSSGDYRSKPIAQWTHWDVSQFFIEGPWGLQSASRDKDPDFIFAAIDKVDGRELLSLTKSMFLNFSPKYGEKLYEHVQQRIAQERGEAPHHHHPTILSSPSSRISPSSPTSTSSTSPHFAAPYTFTTSPHDHPHHLPHPHHPHPSLICDAPARYEVRYKPPPAQPQSRFQGDGGRGGAYNLTPTALRKHLTLPPPLMALSSEGRERVEERRDVAVDAASGGGGGGEQSHPSEEEVKVEPPKKRGPGRPRKPENELKKKKKKTGRLWEFIRNLLLDPETCPSLVKWENAEEGLFRFMDAEKVARKWGDRKQNKEMNYEKLSRAMRYYYKTHIFEAVIGRRLVYKFGKNAKGWRPKNPNFTDVHQNPPPPPPPPPHHHTDTTPPLHHLTESTPQHHHHSDATLPLRHHSDPPLPPPPPAHHHQPRSPPQLHHQHESEHLSQYHHDSPSPQVLVHQRSTTPPPPLTHHHHHHHHHPHPLQSLTMHHHHHHPHHTS